MKIMKPFFTRFHNLLVFSILTLVILQIGCARVDVSTGNYPPFINAAQEGDIAEVDRLFRGGEMPTQTTIGNQTALHVAAAEGQNEMVKWLLAHEANPLAQDLNGKTPADFANQQGHEDTEKILIDYVQLIQDEEKAILERDFDTLRELLVNDYRNYTLLHIFAQNGLVERLLAEIELGADVNVKTVADVTPLHKATIADQVETASLLLQNGADVNAVDNWNNPPIYYAILKDNPDMVRLFLDFDASIDIRSVFRNESIREYAERKGNNEIIQMLNE